jgi:hypothetical protein
MVKVFPHMKELMDAVSHSDKDLKEILAKVVASDTAQNDLIMSIQGSLGTIKDDLNSVKTDVTGLKTGLDGVKLSVHNNVLDILRITVYNDKVPIEDRLVAARRYFLLGGNGKVALYVKGLILTYDKEWSVVIAMSKDEEKAKINSILEGAK